MRLPRPALTLLVLGAFTSTTAAAPMAGLASPAARRGIPAPITPDPALASRPSRALTATLPAASDGTATGGTVRITINPVTGQICVTSVGIAPQVPAAAASRITVPTTTATATATATGTPAPGDSPSPTGLPTAPPSPSASPTLTPSASPEPTASPTATPPPGFPPSAVGLSLALPDGSRLVLTGTGYAGCVTAAPALAAAVLAAPAGYAALLVSTTGEVADAALTPAAAVGRPWSVGVRSETIVDGTRGTARRGGVPARHSRTIRVTYYYPTQGTAQGTNAPASLEGPFPVILFSPGYAVTPQTYERTLRAWAAAGYLVAGVLSPGSGGGLPGTPTEADLGAQPKDLSVVLSAIAAHTRVASSWLGGVADLSRVAVTGHSDGGSTATAAGLLQRYSDPRFDAVIVMAGASFGGARTRKALPLLVLSGQRDEYNSQSTFDQVYRLGHSTRTWVQAIGARHLPPFVVAGRQADDLRALEIAFLDRSLFGANTRSAEHSLATRRGATRIAEGGF